MPTRLLSEIRFFVTTSSTPPNTMMPKPYAGAHVSLVDRAAFTLPLSATRLPAIVLCPCGGSSSESIELGTMPLRLCSHWEFTIERSLLELLPEYPSRLYSDTTSVITAWHGLHWPM